MPKKNSKFFAVLKRPTPPNWISIITIIISIIAIIISSKQTCVQKRIGYGDFLFRFNDTFFKDTANRKIIKCLEYNKPILKRTSNGKLIGEVSEFDLDNFLGAFELLVIYLDKDILDLDMIDTNFGYYIVIAYDNKEIRGYIDDLRKQPRLKDAYTGFEELANKLKKRME